MAYADDLRQTTGVDFEDVADLIDGVAGQWSDFTPSPVSSAGTGTFTTTFAKYARVGDIVNISLYIKFSQATATAPYVTITLPVTSITHGDAQYIGGIYTETGSGRGMGYAVVLSNSTTCRISRNTVVDDFPIAAGVTNFIIANFFYVVP